MSIIDTVYVSVRVLDVPPEFLQLPFHIYIYIYISRKLIIIRFFFIPSKEKKKRFENGIEYFE